MEELWNREKKTLVTRVSPLPRMFIKAPLPEKELKWLCFVIGKSLDTLTAL